MHSLNLTVHPYSHQNNNPYLTDSAISEVAMYLLQGVDGIYTDSPSAVRSAFTLIGSRSNWPKITIPPALI